MADIETLEQFDGWAQLRNGLSRVAAKVNEWAGIPMPIEGHRLIIEPTYPRALALQNVDRQLSTESDGDDGLKLRGRFWSWSHRCYVVVFDDAKTGRVDWGVERGQRLNLDLLTLGASDVWGIEQEQRALHLLAGHLRHRKFKQYLLTGMFLETSKRSGVTYLFRRLKPTVAISLRTGTPKVLCALCLHPIAYYESSWAGAMCPTDDVIAHLLLMRGDEAMFWRRANQHPAWTPEAGI